MIRMNDEKQPEMASGKDRGFYSIAIDGPSGVGKTSIAKRIAEKCGFVYIDTGAMFRALGVHFLDNKVKIEDENAVQKELPGIRLEVRYLDKAQHMVVNGMDVTAKLRTEDVSRAASVISQYRSVRTRLLEMQRELAKTADVVMDGRDIGTVVLPHATLKTFLTALPKVRAERRYKQLAEMGKLEGATLESIEKDIEERDYRDSHREIAPLKPADDAVIIDTSYITIDEVEEKILEALKEKTGA